jgi:tetratricopeptide (TPR) repeat protein
LYFLRRADIIREASDMVEPKRLDAAPAPEAADRDSQAEALLVDGLDRYFKGRYEEAIHLWTRVLFLDRSHARARAYIDRARSALAERQRQADELLQASHDLLEQGQTARARHLLTRAVEASGEDEHVSALRSKLERLERVHAAQRPGPPAAAADAEVVPGWSWPRRSRTVFGALLALVVAVAIIGLAGALVQERLGLAPAADGLRPHTSAAKLPVLSSSDVALVRARTLFDRGRLAEALQALDRVTHDSPQRSTADDLRIEIQQLLLASGRKLSGSRAADSSRR